MPKPPPILLHPNGFLQYELPSGARLHVWHHDCPQAQKVYTPIHDHTFSFESRIILGSLVETIYDFEPIEGHPFGDNPPAPVGNEHQLWAAADGILHPTLAWGSVVPCQQHTYQPGDRYVRRAGVFHKTEAGGEAKYAATVMHKLPADPSLVQPYPRVAIPAGVRPDNEFRRDQYDGSVLWPLVKDALDYLYSTSIGGLLGWTERSRFDESLLPEMIEQVQRNEANAKWNDTWEGLTGRADAHM